jgi:hypothetical protein
MWRDANLSSDEQKSVQHVSSSLSLSLALSKVVNSSTLLISLLLGGNIGNGNTAASE